jgi:hypothetical protein
MQGERWFQRADDSCEMLLSTPISSISFIETRLDIFQKLQINTCVISEIFLYRQPFQ